MNQDPETYIGYNHHEHDSQVYTDEFSRVFFRKLFFLPGKSSIVTKEIR